ncbi:MAG: hypothetical protein HQ481_17440 [Alphaproteobacteria bacterium]|nr:hypothetical protein [Alphaproteobacteria bacterium]
MSALRPPADLALHPIYQVVNTLPRVWPFKHLVIEEFLPPELFAAVMAAPVEAVLQQRNAGPELDHSPEINRFVIHIHKATDLEQHGLSALVRLKETLLDSNFIKLVINKFKDDIEKRVSTVNLNWHTGIEYIEDRSGYALAPHTDTQQKLVTILIYLADPGADPTLGTSLYTITEFGAMPATFRDNSRLPRNAFSRVLTIPYKPNTALIFSPGSNTFHGVEPVSTPGTTRRVLQFQINLES